MENNTNELNNDEGCCSVEEKINSNDSSYSKHNEDEHSNDNAKTNLKQYYPAIISLILLLSGLTFEYLFNAFIFSPKHTKAFPPTACT